MTVLIFLILLLEAVVLAGVFKIIELLLIKDEPCAQKADTKEGSDFWLNIISYDHNKERRR